MTIGYMLFKGTDDKPQFFCGFNGPRHEPEFAQAKQDKDCVVNDPRPILFFFQQDAKEAWMNIELRGIKAELMEINSGWIQWRR